LGVKWVRFDFDWKVIQPDSAENFEWEAYDNVVLEAATSGIRILGVLAYTPSWANGGKESKYYPPKDTATFARFAGRVAERYGADKVAAWEIWNEPNLGDFWQPKANPKEYAQLVRVTSTVLKQASPTSVVVSGGLAQPANSEKDIDARDFLKQLYSVGIGKYIDAVGNHPYTAPHLASSMMGHNWRKMWIGIPSMRDILIANGDASKQIWITEFGAPTFGSDKYNIKVDEATQATMVSDVYSVARKEQWVGPVFWYNYADFCPKASGNSTECHYGLVRFDGSHKPAFSAYQQVP
jgi:hypothetical protein